MARQESVTFDAPVSPRLVHSIATIQDIFETWARQSELRRGLAPVFRRVPVDIVTRPTRPEGAAAAVPVLRASSAAGSIPSRVRSRTAPKRSRSCTCTGSTSRSTTPTAGRGAPGWSGTPRRHWGCRSSKSRPTSVSSPIVTSTGSTATGRRSPVSRTCSGRRTGASTSRRPTRTRRSCHSVHIRSWTRCGPRNGFNSFTMARRQPGSTSCAWSTPCPSHARRCTSAFGTTPTSSTAVGVGSASPRWLVSACSASTTASRRCPPSASREFLQRVVESGTDASVRSWDRHRATWAPYLAEHVDISTRARADGSRRR